MKKGVIAVIIILALLVIVSPGIIGKMAKKSVDENINLAADQSGELIVTSSGFDSGWFSSEGTHRIELGEGNLRQAMMTIGEDGDLPVLVINTRMDHGLIPVSSMGREKGSLSPGLGNAMSTLSIELGDGETFEVPGTIYSNVGLGGDLDSQYVLEAGSKEVENGTLSWQPATIDFAAEPSGAFEFDGNIQGLSANEDNSTMTLGPVTFTGDMQRTDYGYSIGDVSVSFDSMELNVDGKPGLTMGKIVGEQSTRLNGDRVVSDGSAEITGISIPSFGDVGMTVKATTEADAAAMGKFVEAMRSVSGSGDPTQEMMAMQEDMKDFFAGGLNLDFEQFDVSLPMGMVESSMTFDIPASDRSSFEWTSLLLSTVAAIDIKVPEALVQMATEMNPQAGAIVGMGYLRKEGDHYVMDADYEKGLLTVNGAPIPIPVGAF